MPSPFVSTENNGKGERADLNIRNLQKCSTSCTT